MPSRVLLAGIGFESSHPLNVAGSATIGGALHALQNQAGIKSVLNFGDLTILRGGMLTAYGFSKFQDQSQQPVRLDEYAMTPHLRPINDLGDAGWGIVRK